MAFLHPISVLSSARVVLPPDLALEADDTRTLSNALRTAISASGAAVQITDLDPLNFFGSKSGFLIQKDITIYESRLKEQFLQVADVDGSSVQEDVIRSFRVSFDPSRHTTVPDISALEDNLIRLLTDLSTQGDLVCCSNILTSYLCADIPLACNPVQF